MLDVRTAMRRAAMFNKNRIAIVADGRELTFAEAWTRGLRFANGLLSLGLKPGDRVAVLEDNCLESSDFFLGSVAANLVRVPLYRRNAREGHRHMLAHTQAKALVVASEYLHEVECLQDELEDLEHVIVRDEGYARWLAQQADTDPDPGVGLDDLHLIRHSAGTTGVPKGIAFTHRSWMSTERDLFLGLPPIEVGDRCQHAGPISHGSGYLFVPIWLGGGASMLESKFDVQRTLETLSAVGGYFFAVPTMLADLVGAARTQDLDFSRVKAIEISAAPIRAPTALAAHEVFGDVLYQFYGQTEAFPVVHMGPREWFGDIDGSEPLRAAGHVAPFAQVEIRNEENRPLPPHEPGEIAVRSEGQMSGIWRDPELTTQRLVDGWVLTGDVGYLDDNGFLYVVDRKDDMIISGGFNIWPAELETVIAELPGVREVAVFGVPDDRWGETPCAVVVVEEGAELTEEGVIAACRERLGSYKKPAVVTLRTDPLPRSIVGKILRRDLRDPYWAGRDRRVGGA